MCVREREREKESEREGMMTEIGFNEVENKGTKERMKKINFELTLTLSWDFGASPIKRSNEKHPAL